nr:M1 family aminopeptidase [Pseudoalteromonas sp. MMG013]
MLFLIIAVVSLNANAMGRFDVLSYTAQLTPDIENHSLTGRVTVDFRIAPSGQLAKESDLEFRLQAPDMQIKRVHGPMVKGFHVTGDQLILALDSRLNGQRGATEVTIDYDTSPKKGLKFFDGYMYTLYNTANWLVSHDDIGDKATFDLTLNLPKGMAHVANGRKISSKPNGELMQHHWREDRARPIYTFGFAAGDFLTHQFDAEGMHYSVLYQDLSQQDVVSIFADIKQAYRFFSKVSNKELSHKRYTFVVTKENTMQEAGAFSLVGARFMKDVLVEKRENWLAPHELAHEWWGNSISAKSWNDFWLNEGLVQFMVAAFKEHAYGKEEYDREIILFKESMLRLQKQGNILPAVSPRQEITFEQFKSTYRKAAYSKGAYLFHMLRLELGEQDFWDGIRIYSQENWESVATTEALRKAFEKAAGHTLDGFFERWVHSKQTTTLAVDVAVNSHNVLTLDVTHDGYPHHYLPLWVEIDVDGKAQLLKFQVTKNTQQFVKALKMQPASIVVDPQQYFPITVSVTGIDEYLVENVEKSKETLPQYWSMKRLIHSKYCAQEPALIQHYLKHFDTHSRARILRTATDWWQSKCPTNL